MASGDATPIMSRVGQRFSTLKDDFTNMRVQEDVAKAGFYKIDADRDHLYCAFCKVPVPLSDFQKPGVNPSNLHAKWSPRCWFVMKEQGTMKINALNGYVDTEHEVSPWGVNGPVYGGRGDDPPTGNLKGRGGCNFYEPRMSNMADPDPRWESYLHMDTEINVYHAVHNGLFYDRDSGSNQCYWCGIRIDNLQPNVHPVVEHVRRSPNCWHIKLTMGEEYVNKIVVICKEDQEQNTDGEHHQMTEGEYVEEAMLSDDEHHHIARGNHPRESMSSDELHPKRLKTSRIRNESLNVPVGSKDGQSAAKRLRVDTTENVQKADRLRNRKVTLSRREEAKLAQSLDECATINTSDSRTRPLESQCCICRTDGDTVAIKVCCRQPVCNRVECLKYVRCSRCVDGRRSGCRQ